LLEQALESETRNIEAIRLEVAQIKELLAQAEITQPEIPDEPLAEK